MKKIRPIAIAIQIRNDFVCLCHSVDRFGNGHFQLSATRKITDDNRVFFYVLIFWSLSFFFFGFISMNLTALSAEHIPN